MAVMHHQAVARRNTHRLKYLHLRPEGILRLLCAAGRGNLGVMPAVKPEHIIRIGKSRLRMTQKYPEIKLIILSVGHFFRILNTEAGKKIPVKDHKRMRHRRFEQQVGLDAF